MNSFAMRGIKRSKEQEGEERKKSRLVKSFFSGKYRITKSN